MRLAFFILLLSNAVLLAWGQGLLAQRESWREPDRWQHQIDPDKLILLTAAAQTPSPAPVIPAIACRRVDGLSVTEAEKLQKTLATPSGWTLDVQARKEKPLHWVLIAELPSRALAEKKRGELRQLGVDTGTAEIVEDSTLGPFTVSLGLFKHPAGADELLKSLVRKGVRSARQATREAPVEQFAIEIRAPAQDLVTRLPELLAGFATTGVSECAPP